ncbi:MAG: hypothetical protein KBT12_08210 [Bacteroidales bacterium]|nr:hypothetical protein [Candidatus Physcousia equi]
MMKRISVILLVALLAMVSTSVVATAQTKSAKRIAYTIKNLKLNDQQAKALHPILVKYLADMKVAKKAYKDLEDKYKRDIEFGTLTDKAAAALLAAKFECDGKELQVKKTYLPKFQAAIPAKKVYQLYDFINDKMSKIDAANGVKSSKGNSDEEE